MQQQTETTNIRRTGEAEPERIRCVVERVFYHDPGSLYTAALCSDPGGNRRFKVAGHIASPCEGMPTEAEGQWVVDPRYGFQFSAEAWFETLPVTAEGIRNYLSNGEIAGIGPKSAEAIVGVFGDKTLEVISKAPHRLAEVPGIGAKRAEKIAAAWKEEDETREVMLFLQGFGISPYLAHRIYGEYGKDSINVMRADPYRLCDDVWGIGFVTADSIAAKLGVEKDSPGRLRSGIRYVLQSMSAEGHCYAEKEDLVKKSSGLLGVGAAKVEEALAAAIRTGAAASEGGKVYLPAILAAERRVAAGLASLSEGGGQAAVPFLKKTGGITYDAGQEKAIRGALENGVFYITGGPGTGKTTITKAVIASLEARGRKVLLAAPTGKAAKRMSEATGHEAKTIHRMLEFSPNGTFKRDRDNPLEGDDLIVDECSMIDIFLMDRLLRAVPEGMRLVLVGDADQLPSVGPGNVLGDIIKSGAVPGARLEHIFRQAGKSRIVTNAHRINKGRMPGLDKEEGSDFFFIEAGKGTEQERVADAVVKLVSESLPERFGLDPMRDVQVIAPVKKGGCGVHALNERLRDVLNPVSGKDPGKARFRKGDKVMQIRNDYGKGVFNGDTGRVLGEDPDTGETLVMFDSGTASYKKKELDELMLAYAATVHKSQGSEYRAVVMPFMDGACYKLLSRNLLYTAVTRAKEVFVMVGTEKAVAISVGRPEAGSRNTMLASRLREEALAGAEGGEEGGHGA